MTEKMNSYIKPDFKTVSGSHECKGVRKKGYVKGYNVSETKTQSLTNKIEVNVLNTPPSIATVAASP